MNTKECSKCKASKPITDFPTRTVNGKSYPHSFCRVCKNAERMKYAKNQPSPEATRAYQNAHRADPANRASYIYKDSRNSDRKKGLENDLDIEFIRAALLTPCTYCGADDILKSLDRIDNTLGHCQANVLVSCQRCNLTRRNMPHAAWLVVAEGMRKAREKGLFGDWLGK
jgi:hypothetical protein